MSALLASTIDHAVIFFDPAGSVLEWLGAAERLFGYTPEEALGLPFSVFFTAEDRQLGLDAQEMNLAKTSGRSEDDRWHVRKDGSLFWANGVLHAVRDAQGSIVVFCKIARDRTDIATRLAAMQNQISARNERIAEQQRFMTKMGHELRNPMMPIMSAVAVLQSSDEPRVNARARDIIERQVWVLKKILDDVGENINATPPLLKLEMRPVDLHEALLASAHGLSDCAAAQGLDLQLILPAGRIWIEADAERLQQMLSNLLGNAIKYTPHGGKIGLSATVEADMAVIRVEDDGEGIASDVLPRIFELFTREPRVSGIPGSGIGLAVVQDLARRHGGGVEARSPGPGKGSAFALRLPLRQP
ncbi:hypothetical protein BH11PSE8_BH11PSE8_24240 [soil metagenome]